MALLTLPRWFPALCVCVAVLCGGCGSRPKAEKAVTAFMQSQHADYSAIGFGEFFEQTYPAEIEAALGTDERVVHSLVHSYRLGSEVHSNTYFHLSENFEVIGQLSDDEMTEITRTLMKPYLDNLLKEPREGH